MDKKYDHKTAELSAQTLWQDRDLYSAENNPGPLYNIDTPPPTVSGSLHIGHIFSYTQADIIARFKRMSGFSVFYPFGFDDNGLPTERYIEKKLKITAQSMSRSEFINLCLRETTEAEKEFEVLWRRIGLSVDWKASYSTIDENSRFISQLSFIELYKKGFVYRKNEPALFCTACRTTVAQAELDDLEKASTFSNIVFLSGDERLLVGTTRPELLAAVNALFFHPSDKRYLHLIGKEAVVPYYNNTVPILTDELVDPEKGTGLVMSSTFGDKTDILWFKKHNLNYKPIIMQNGSLSEETGILAGLRVPAAREKILELLQDKGLLQSSDAISHNVNVHERCKKEIEYLILPQWFLSILDHKEKFVELAHQIKWNPSFMKSRYINWVENLSWDWCISRQRFYGIPFPAWHCTSCNELVLAEASQLPIDPQEVPYTGTCPCGSSSFVPDTDVMDTWNTSSLTPYLCANLRLNDRATIFEKALSCGFIPMAMRPQAHDIIRTWAFDTIVKVWMHNESIPWKEIVISGHVLAAEKGKLSKSKGNSTLTPEALLTTYPADAVRFWTASGGLGHDISFSENRIAIGQKLLIKLWNAFRFAQPYIGTVSKPDKLGLINEWILHNLSSCFSTYSTYFEKHEFSLALNTIDQFFWSDFCDNYIEMTKDQLMNPDNYPAHEVEATRYTLFTVGLRILQLYAPFVPHITETLYGLLYKEQVGIPSIHQTKYSAIQVAYTFEQSVQEMYTIIELIGQIRKLKTEHQLSLKTALATLTIVSNEQLQAIVRKQEHLIKAITRSEELVLVSQSNEPSGLKESDENWHALVTL